MSKATASTAKPPAKRSTPQIPQKKAGETEVERRIRLRLKDKFKNRPVLPPERGLVAQKTAVLDLPTPEIEEKHEFEHFPVPESDNEVEIDLESMDQMFQNEEMNEKVENFDSIAQIEALEAEDEPEIAKSEAVEPEVALQTGEMTHTPPPRFYRPKNAPVRPIIVTPTEDLGLNAGQVLLDLPASVKAQYASAKPPEMSLRAFLAQFLTRYASLAEVEAEKPLIFDDGMRRTLEMLANRNFDNAEEVLTWLNLTSFLKCGSTYFHIDPDLAERVVSRRDAGQTLGDAFREYLEYGIMHKTGMI